MTLNVGTLSADLDLDDNPFERGLDRAFSTGQNKATQIGDKMTKGVTLPIAAAGTAAFKLSMDFDTSMSRIVGLVGLSTSEVDQLRSGVMDLAGETAKSPQELADALFTVTSAGFKGAEAMDVLEQAAKASAAGLGETRTIAEALTGAVNAYGPEVLDAASATDILVATARAGNFETSQLAGSLGRVTPFAKQAGASLEDVGGAVALLTRVNNNATESVTQITALMRAFVVPTQEANTILGDLGMTAEDIRTSIGERGLVATLQDLDQKLGGNREQLGKLLGSSEAASAAFQILEADAKTLEGTFGTVADAAGMTDEAFDAAAGTSGFKMKQAFAQLQVALIQAGDAIAPFVTAVAGGLSTVAEAFSKLPAPIQGVIVGFAMLLAAVGPVMSIGGRVVASWTLISAALDKAAISAYNAAGGFAAAAVPLATIVAAAAAVTVAVKRIGDEMDEAGDDGNAMARQIIGSFDASSASAKEFEEQYSRLHQAQDDFLEAENNATNPLLKERHEAARKAIEAEIVAMEEAGKKAGELMEVQGLSADEALRLATNTDIVAGATDEATGEFDAAAAALAGEEQQIQETVDAFAALADALRAQFDPLFAAQDATLNLQDAQKKAADAAAEFGEGSLEAADANREVVRAATENEEAQIRLRAAIEKGDVKLSDAVATLDRWVAQGVLTEDQAAKTKDEFGWLALAAGSLEERNITIPVAADTSAIERQIAELYRARSGIRISVGGSGGIPLRAHGGPYLANQDTLVGEDGPEIVRFSASGVVHNAGQTRAMLDGSDGGSIDYDRLAPALAAELAKMPAPVVRVSDVDEGLRTRVVARL